ncbi:2-amino-4-hydroxy-6-hydroxymethyldihydropteridine diphosphokinase [Alkalimarinus sediminis]|uniref:2-amino-4-hydroxy-6-hydroxymethyldihydropteridine diphosphokinase n=1 Tax=Alkalimarinus sediminis TaxID=1632866 RepID=A0A9E8KJS9_9ALTE|nr:2-amino-4-hydroxy-6-hydroxymethyldihydropteridine diphosphokinase [Alkalimarinus sediminis]UZW75351.1 2-amino-4-hydroxy-6-hydroxymethyldihydropteridine diphosphokinase [Alkalimarinus sediminis]
MAEVYVSIGSNIEPELHVTAALDALQDYFGALQVSSVFESESVGFKGDCFLNLVVGFDTTMAVGELSLLLKQIESENGRVKNAPKFCSRTLDIDILTYDDRVGEVDGVSLPRSEILENAFVLWPLAEVAGDQVHPEVLKTYSQLWQAFDKSQKLKPVDFIWQGDKVSPMAR